jgi:DinB superfamily
MPDSDQVEVLLGKLNAARARLLEGVRRLDAAQITMPADDGWSVKDVLAHVAAAEELNVRFAKLMVSQERPVQLEAFAANYPDFTGPFSLDSFNAYMADKLRANSPEEVLGGLDETRARTRAWAEKLTPDQLECRGVHAVWGDQNVRDMLRILALHDRLHTNDILKIAERVARKGDGGIP